MAKLVYHAYTVVDYDRNGERKAKWFKIGSAFEHKDGGGYDVALAAVPVNGRIALRKPKSKEALAAMTDEDGPKIWFGD